ncbi:Fur family transcriptional regulator [Nocardia sp. NPDC049707]|uniref:Fur family transcriptional regulator n=1 Tax=Nocardia sp. NPDC049707 TaxID=3154735 RepID=UPI0034190CCB
MNEVDDSATTAAPFVGQTVIDHDTRPMLTAGASGDPAVERARSILRSCGLRCTAPRLAVMSVLTSNPAAGHLTVQEIVARLTERREPVDLTTVYRTLARMVEMGALHVLTVGERAASYGLTVHPHHHAVCTRCSVVIEVPAEQLTTALDHASRGSRFELADTAGLTLHGLCPACQKVAC